MIFIDEKRKKLLIIAQRILSQNIYIPNKIYYEKYVCTIQSLCPKINIISKILWNRISIFYWSNFAWDLREGEKESLMNKNLEKRCKWKFQHAKL